MSKRRTKEEVAAWRVITQTAKAQRAYDQAKERRLRLMLKLDEISDKLRQAHSEESRVHFKAIGMGLAIIP